MAPLVTPMEEDLQQILMSPLMIMTEGGCPIDNDNGDANSSMVEPLLGQSIEITIDEGRGDAEAPPKTRQIAKAILVAKEVLP
jgi:hypothetical protein